jgi:hypothetical protein
MMNQVERNKKYRERLKSEGIKRVDLKIPSAQYAAIQSKLAKGETVTSWLLQLVADNT